MPFGWSCCRRQMTRRPIRPGSTTSSGNCVRMDWPVGIVCCIRNRQRARMSSTRCAVSECRNERCLIDSAGPNTLLNLSYSIHPPFLLQFERRIFCDLDPSEIFYWMTKMELGQSSHDEFWTIGLNVKEVIASCRNHLCAGKHFIRWLTRNSSKAQPRPRLSKFTTIGQWYWSGAVEVAGEFPDLSKRVTFEPYLGLPARVPEAQFELAMNISPDDPERARLQRLGWRVVDPHRVARTPNAYRRYMASAACGVYRHQGR